MAGRWGLGQVRCLRDPTRGGLASAVNELAARSRVGMLLDERRISVGHFKHRLNVVNCGSSAKVYRTPTCMVPSGMAAV